MGGGGGIVGGKVVVVVAVVALLLLIPAGPTTGITGNILGIMGFGPAVAIALPLVPTTILPLPLLIVVLALRYFRMGLLAANILSALDPCLSLVTPPPEAWPPVSSFVVVLLKAYSTTICRLQRYWLFIQAMAISLASKESNDTNPNPLD
jgi:hypothetical protein